MSEERFRVLLFTVFVFVILYLYYRSSGIPRLRIMVPDFPACPVCGGDCVEDKKKKD